ncbi:MAG: hypothetical protein IT347_04605 [Candidatus Eisenbacteria bacterium]|nr:hypothetical protein [Candidatus Eisenbacteria bacterium]
MKVEIRITDARRQDSTGPRALYWQVSFNAVKEGETPYAGLAAAWQRTRDDFGVAHPILPNDLPHWLPPDIVAERVHWYVLNQLSSAIEQPDGTLSDALKVVSPIVDEFEVIGEVWNYLGMRVLSSLAE